MQCSRRCLLGFLGFFHSPNRQSLAGRVEELRASACEEREVHVRFTSATFALLHQQPEGRVLECIHHRLSPPAIHPTTDSTFTFLAPCPPPSLSQKVQSTLFSSFCPTSRRWADERTGGLFQVYFTGFGRVPDMVCFLCSFKLNCFLLA